MRTPFPSFRPSLYAPAWLGALALGATLAAQAPARSTVQYPVRGPAPSLRALPPHADGAVPQRILSEGPGGSRERVAFDREEDGRIWALGATYKASFGT